MVQACIRYRSPSVMRRENEVKHAKAGQMNTADVAIPRKYAVSFRETHGLWAMDYGEESE
jgi:hypothetical protein